MEKTLSRNNITLFYTMVFLVALTSAALAASGMALKMFILFVCATAFVLIITWPEYGIMAFIASFLLYTPEFLKGSQFLTLNNVLGVVFCLLLCIYLLREKDLRFLKTRQIQLMAALGIVFIVSFLLARKPPSLIREVRVTDLPKKELWDYFTQFAFVIFMIHFLRTGKGIKMVLALLMSLVAVSSLSAMFVGIGRGDDYRAVSSFGIKMATNSNYLAFYCLFAIVTLYYWRQKTKSTVLKVLSLAWIASLVYVVFLSGSRTAFLCTLFLIVIMLVESGVTVGRIIATGIFIVLIGAMVVTFVPEQNLKRITSMKGDPSQKEASASMSDRIQTLRTGFKMFSDHNVLIGIGPGSFRWMRLLHYDHKKLATHNAFLWALLSGGIVALGLYLLLFWQTWKDLRWMERQPSTASSPPIWAVKTVRTVLLLFLLFSAFGEVWLEIILFLLVGLTISMKRMYEAVDRAQLI
jgi:O-antigen ligase